MKSNHTNHQNPMNHINSLRQTLKPSLQWHEARLSFSANMYGITVHNLENKQ